MRVCIDGRRAGHHRASARPTRATSRSRTSARSRRCWRRSAAGIEFNIEGDPRPDLLALVHEVRPGPVHARARAAGGDHEPGRLAAGHAGERDRRRSSRACRTPGSGSACSSTPSRRRSRWAAAMGADRVELYTEPFARAFERGGDAARSSFAQYADGGGARARARPGRERRPRSRSRRTCRCSGAPASRRGVDRPRARSAMRCSSASIAPCATTSPCSRRDGARDDARPRCSSAVARWSASRAAVARGSARHASAPTMASRSRPRGTSRRRVRRRRSSSCTCCTGRTTTGTAGVQRLASPGHRRAGVRSARSRRLAGVRRRRTSRRASATSRRRGASSRPQRRQPARIGIARRLARRQPGGARGRRRPGVASLALLSPSLDYRGLRIEAAMRKYGARPVLLVVERRRSLRVAVGARTSQKARAACARLLRLSDAGHGPIMLERDPDLPASLVDWFRRTLL